jgi:uncharacterized protein YuzE
MQYEFDASADILVIRVRKGKPEYGEQDGNVITHYSKDGQVVQLEILDATKETATMITSIMRAQKFIAADSK